MKGVCNDKKISRGEIYVADLNLYQGSEQGGIRPVVILQNDAGNYFSSTEEDFKQDQIFACIKATQKEAKARGKMLYMPLRIATTGIMHGPDLAASMELLGKEKVLKRLG